MKFCYYLHDWQYFFYIYFMSDKELQKLKELAREKLQKSIVREDAVRSLQKAGILDKEEQYTEPYSHLAKAGSSK